MTDRELLELAAKAAGIETTSGALDFVHPEGVWRPCGMWNPLTDDGDALRLAVRLKIDLCFDNGGVESIWINEDISETHTLRENADGVLNGWHKKEAATRRAIVRAAAEIGKEIK